MAIRLRPPCWQPGRPCTSTRYRTRWRRALLEGARLAALHLLRSRDAVELALHARDTALHGALTGSWTAGEVSLRLGLRPGSDLSLIGFAPHDDGRAAPAPTAAVAGALLRYFAAHHGEASLTSTPSTVYVLLPASGDRSAHRMAAAALARAPSDLGRLDAAVCAGADPAALPLMRQEVDDVLSVTTQRPGPASVAGMADVHALVVLSRLAAVLAAEPGLRHPGVTAMSRHDADHRSQYLVSVLAWLGAVGDVGSAAGLLGVHPNTLRYRLRRAGELFDLELADADQRLSTWLQLRLLREETTSGG